MRRLFFATAAAVMTSLIAASVGSAGRVQMTLICNGEPLTVTVTQTTNDNSVAWGVGTISGGSHGIPVSFSGSATDLKTGAQVFSFSQAKGNGNGMHNQPTITCTQTSTGTAADFGIVGAPGVNPSDMIEQDFTATVVLKP
jgi:hypothetical protein